MNITKSQAKPGGEKKAEEYILKVQSEKENNHL